ncbi:hypothetical protein Cch01nite_40340 [Cellulomonas chitinilytica]|uniref:Uncharacterized protein n=1 Tax=Cellulomonas chitinilytica TaxID=398759 RepID=A0A919P6S7_9CELL|nr:hypothetical protein [Cellulomonas chitinilytica]GIG23310.1 hypothetical protein Cch01nite_40340 [Cellulomonas chitinilytica]
MSVADQLGLTDPDHGAMAEARQSWPCWVAASPRLGVVGDLLELPDWIAAADPADADLILHELARRASCAGEDDRIAAATLAWLLKPGARLLARRLAGLAGNIDHVVAAQLWIEIRTFPCDRLRKVAANVLWNTRRGVLQELGVSKRRTKNEEMWARALRWDPLTMGDLPESGSDEDGADDVMALLDCAVAERVIDRSDRDLLVSVAVAVDGASGIAGARGGLCSTRTTDAIGAACGISGQTVRRRVRRSVHALSVAYANAVA